MLKEIESYIDGKFSQAKELRDDFEVIKIFLYCIYYIVFPNKDELRVYHQLRNYVNLKIQADYQDNVSHFAEMASKYERIVQNRHTHLSTLCIIRTPQASSAGNRATKYLWRMMPGGGSSVSKGLGELKRAASTVSYMSLLYVCSYQ